MGLLDGKIAVITGASRGFGVAIAQAYVGEGGTVVIASRSSASVEEALASLKAGGAQAGGIACDVADRAQVEALAEYAIEKFGHFDIWVNNAGISGPYGPTYHIAPETFTQVVQTNILGVYHGSMVALRHFVPRGSGKLINVMGAGYRRPTPFQNAYASSKAWVRSFTLALAKEQEGSGVGVFALQPGMMRTELIQNVEVVSGYEERLKVFPTVIRMFAKSPDVPAQKAVWLASAATDGRTGMEVLVSGRGALMWGALQEMARRLLRRPAPLAELTVTTVPSAVPGHAEQE